MKNRVFKKQGRCWEFFHCLEERHQNCLMSEVQEWRCWLVNIACCKISGDTPNPLSVKNSVCKTCGFYTEFRVFE